MTRLKQLWLRIRYGITIEHPDWIAPGGYVLKTSRGITPSDFEKIKRIVESS